LVISDLTWLNFRAQWTLRSAVRRLRSLTGEQAGVWLFFLALFSTSHIVSNDFRRSDLDLYDNRRVSNWISPDKAVWANSVYNSETSETSRSAGWKKAR
jgi:hypothetical protein